MLVSSYELKDILCRFEVMFSLSFYDNSHCMTVRIGHMTNIMLIRIILSLYWDIAHTGFQKVTTCFVLYWYLCLNGNLHIKRTMQQIIKQCLTEAPWNEFWKLILKNGKFVLLNKLQFQQKIIFKACLMQNRDV